MPKLKDYEILAPFSADELIRNANTLLGHIPQAQLQKRTLRFYSSQGLLPPPEGPRSKAQYRYEHLVILVALRLFKHLGLKLDLIEEVIRNQRAEGIERLEQTVQQYLDKTRKSPYGVVQERAEDVANILLADEQEDYLTSSHLGIMHFSMPLLGARRLLGASSAPLRVKKTMRIQLTPDVTLEFDEEKPLQNALQEAYQKLKKLLKQTP
ncbi:MAG: MerR family transcriptional regulator [Armatimonadota bacterium]|nr:MerR family transcriptional regulator [bacterium]MDW8320622.1 MerR family transcriptional regulator [Armatimonadota bacterium]